MKKRPGICKRCGREDDSTMSGAAFCEVCAAQRRQVLDDRRREHRCLTCGAPDKRTLSGETLCGKCAAAEEEAKRREEARRAAAERRAEEERIKAEELRVKAEEAMKKLQEEPEPKPIKVPTRYELRKESGACTHCGKVDERTMAGSVCCAECAEKAAERGRLRKARLRADHACVKCGRVDERTLAGRVNCARCYQREKDLKCRRGWSREATA